MPQLLVAIDLSTTAARLALCEITFRSVVLTQLFSVPYTPGSSRDDFFKKLRESLPPKIDLLNVVIDGNRTSSRVLKFPFGDVRKVEAAVEFELESNVPYSLEDIAISWQAIDKTSVDTTVLTAITPRLTLQDELASMTHAGLEPRVMTFPASLLKELVEDVSVDGPFAVLSLGATVSHLAIIRHNLRYVRTLRAGGDDVDRSIMANFNISLAEARQFKEQESERLFQALHEAEDKKPDEKTDEKKFLSAVRTGLFPLLSGLNTTFKTLAAADKPQRVFITGGLVHLFGLKEFLNKQLNLPIDVLDLKQALVGKMTTKITEIKEEYNIAVALALASTSKQAKGLSFNFRRGSLAYQGYIQLYRKQIVRLLMGICILFFLAITGGLLRHMILKHQEKKLDKAFCKVTEKILNRQICDPQAAMAVLKQSPGVADGISIPTYSATTMLEMISRAVTKDIDVTFEELDLRLDSQSSNAGRITGRGEAASFDATDQLLSALKKDSCVQEADILKQRKVQDTGRVEFNLVVKVNCPPGVIPTLKLDAPAPLPTTPPPSPDPSSPPAPESNLKAVGK